jgi:hypothetical protein
MRQCVVEVRQAPWRCDDLLSACWTDQAMPESRIGDAAAGWDGGDVAIVAILVRLRYRQGTPTDRRQERRPLSVVVQRQVRPHQNLSGLRQDLHETGQVCTAQDLESDQADSSDAQGDREIRLRYRAMNQLWRQMTRRFCLEARWDLAWSRAAA